MCLQPYQREVSELLDHAMTMCLSRECFVGSAWEAMEDLLAGECWQGSQRVRWTCLKSIGPAISKFKGGAHQNISSNLNLHSLPRITYLCPHGTLSVWLLAIVISVPFLKRYAYVQGVTYECFKFLSSAHKMQAGMHATVTCSCVDSGTSFNWTLVCRKLGSACHSSSHITWKAILESWRFPVNWQRLRPMVMLSRLIK